MPSQLQTIEQERAKSAWQKIQAVIAESEKLQDKDKIENFKKKYSGLARSMPAMVQNAGMGQALAFLRAKDKGNKGQPNKKFTAEWLFYCHLSTWIHEQNKTQGIGESGLLEWLIQQTSEQYRQITAEIIGYLRWLKRFAEAELPEPEAGGDR